MTERNAHRPRLLATRAGDVELKIPKLGRAASFPSLLEPRRRIDRALWAVVMEAYVAGVSTRSVDDLVAALGAESGISKSEVSRISAGLDEVVEVFRSRRLDHIEFPYVYLDATYLNVRNDRAQPASMATVVATGITADSNREVLGCDVGDSESEGFWQQFLASLRDQGLSGVRLAIADAHRGLAAQRPCYARSATPAASTASPSSPAGAAPEPSPCPQVKAPATRSSTGSTSEATGASTACSTSPQSPNSAASPKRPSTSPARPPKARPDAKPDEPTNDTSPTASSAACGATKPPDTSPTHQRLDKGASDSPHAQLGTAAIGARRRSRRLNSGRASGWVGPRRR